MSYPLQTLPTVPDDPAAIDAAKALPLFMSFMKNVIIRGLNSAHLISDIITPSHSGFRSYLKYLRNICDILSAHFKGDHYFFTTPKQCGDPLMKVLTPACNPSVEAFEAALDKLRGHIDAYVKDPKTYSPSTIQGCLNFGPKMVEKMKAQICAIQSQKSLDSIPSEELVQMIVDSMQWYVDNTDMTFTVPFILSHHDRSTSTYWPPSSDEAEARLPDLLKVHAECWQFAPFDPVTRAPKACSP